MWALACYAAATAAAVTRAFDPPNQPPALNKPPGFSWTTLGGMTFAHITKSTEFNATDLALLKKYRIVQFDKGQNGVSMPYASLEDRFIAAARQVKEANPKATLLMYLNGLIDFPAFQRLSNKSRADPSLLITNPATKKMVTTLPPYGTFDMRNAAMRQLFVSDAEYGVHSGVFDGVFIDRANWAVRGLSQLVNGTEGQQKGLANNGWTAPIFESLIPAQTQLFRDLTAALGPDAVVLAKETGAGAGFDDWKVANAAMTTDTFCSSYAPNVPDSAGGTWSPPTRGHVGGFERSLIRYLNTSFFSRCEEICDREPGCEAVQYNTQIERCWLLNTTFNEHFVCMNGTGVEWVANKAAPGEPSCPATVGGGFDPVQCLADMQAIVDAASRRQLTESHGQGPPGDPVSREFTTACFLVAAGNFSYFSHASWLKSGAWSLSGTEWWPEYDYPLGEPLDPPMMRTPSGEAGQFRRRFASGTVVSLDVPGHSAQIKWAHSPAQ